MKVMWVSVLTGEDYTPFTTAKAGYAEFQVILG